jgi:L-alanine-DL-glutamate epimerase-like enolase superfamily enzyme
VKITDVRASVIGQQVPDSGGSVWTFVRIYTDEGIMGTGECNSAGAASGFATKEAILTLKPLLLGKDPMNVGPLYETLRRSGRYGGTTGAPIIFAITGIENALYDIVGKALNVPVYKLLGGKYRDKIRLYADCHAGDSSDPQAYADKALEVIAEGYSAVKFDVDGIIEVGKLDPYNYTAGAKEMSHIIKVIETTKAAMGNEIDLAIDCHGQFDLPSAITLAKAVEDLRLLWLEEPVPAENIDALVQVRRSSSTVICTGENHYTRYEFIELLQRQATDIIMPDLAKAGGIMEAKRIADIADAYYVPIAPHNVSSPLGMMAACHVMASVPNFLLLEFHGRGISWWEDLCDGDKPYIQAGWMQVSERPGIGVELNDKVAKTLLWNGDSYFGE